MLLLIDIFSINKGQGYENPILEIIVTEHYLIGGCPLKEACEHCFLNQSVIYVVFLISFMCYCEDFAGYITVILPFLSFYFCSTYLLYLVSCSNEIYSISSLEPQFKYIAMMTYRLYGREDTTHFFLPWVPLMHTVMEGCSFDWAKLLSDSLTNWIIEYRTQRVSGKATSFFMSAYIMDIMCFMTPFPLMIWIWAPSDSEPIHVYHSKLWEDKASDFIYEIFNWVMVSMHVTIFGNPPPRISYSIMVNLSSVANWYVEEEFSYIKVFGASIPLHALPLFILDRLACHEIARKTVISGISKEIKGFSKKVWPPFPIHLTTYSLLNFEHAKAEATSLEDIKLVHFEFKKHDPHRVFSNHLASCGLKRFEHENSPHDDIFRGARSYVEDLAWIQAWLPEERDNFFKFQ
jgi:hypothetical protein